MRLGRSESGGKNDRAVGLEVVRSVRDEEVERDGDDHTDQVGLLDDCEMVSACGTAASQSNVLSVIALRKPARDALGPE